MALIHGARVLRDVLTLAAAGLLAGCAVPRSASPREPSNIERPAATDAPSTIAVTQATPAADPWPVVPAPTVAAGSADTRPATTRSAATRPATTQAALALPEGTFLLDRRARLARDAHGHPQLLLLDASGAPASAPVPLLPNAWAMRMEDAAAADPGAVFVITGLVTWYRDRDYVLLRSVVRASGPTSEPSP